MNEQENIAAKEAENKAEGKFVFSSASMSEEEKQQRYAQMQNSFSRVRSEVRARNENSGLIMPGKEPDNSVPYNNIAENQSVVFNGQYALMAKSKKSTAYRAGTPSVLKIRTKRNVAKFILLNILTVGIYGICMMSGIASDINSIAERYDGKRTMPFLAAMILSLLTVGIFGIVWTHMLCTRIGKELERRKIEYRFDAAEFWIWGIFGLLVIIGPFVFVHKLTRAMNELGQHYNCFG